MQSDFTSPVQCCMTCRLRIADCACAEAPRLDIATRLIVIIHAKEWRRSSNTGYLARLATKAGEVRVHGLPHQAISSEGIDAGSRATLALYPGRGAIPLTAAFLTSLPRPLTLLVPDGNWMQAKNMMRRLPMLARAQPVRLDGPSLGLACLRRNAYPDRMSTFEAIAQALGILENETIAATMLNFFRHVLPHMALSKQRTANIHVS
ncbi:MAG: DTW domain-containing protein [Gemmataceae bacterium]|nr:DTW domain-containing protein [Gemmataceae bacterium]